MTKLTLHLKSTLETFDEKFSEWEILNGQRKNLKFFLLSSFQSMWRKEIEEMEKEIADTPQVDKEPTYIKIAEERINGQTPPML